jgi:hypothetical protein
MSESSTTCVVCSTACPDDDASWKPVSDQLSFQPVTIQTFLLDKDVLPAEATAFGLSRICARCSSLVHSCDALYLAIDENVRRLREIRQHTVGCILQETSGQLVDSFFDDEFGDARDAVRLPAISTLGIVEETNLVKSCSKFAKVFAFFVSLDFCLKFELFVRVR